MGGTGADACPAILPKNKELSERAVKRPVQSRPLVEQQEPRNMTINMDQERHAAGFLPITV